VEKLVWGCGARDVVRGNVEERRFSAAVNVENMTGLQP
jgi:hypothetical protein